MTLSSAEIKRQILVNAKTSVVRRKMEQNLPGISEGEQLEIGNDLEALTKMKGWNLIEAYMLRFIYQKLQQDKDDPEITIRANGFRDLMQWVQVAIEKKDQILEKERLKYEAKSVSKDEGE